MMAWLVGSSLRFGRLVVVAAVAVLGFGLVQLRSASVDVYPEFRPPAVQVQAEALGLSAQEVEQLITVPLEQDLLNGVPWLDRIRSTSMPGLSAIDLEFEPGTDLYQARQMVQERMTQAKALPNVGTPPVMVQPEASASRIAMIALTSRTVSPIDMSVLARWQLRPRLMSIPGVANVSVWGQRDRQLQVQVDPDRLAARTVTLTQLIESTGNALWVSPLSFVEASTPGTGGFVETPNQRLGVQHVSPILSSKQLADVAIEGPSVTPMRIGDVARVVEDHQPLIGDAAAHGERSVMVVVDRFPDANTAQVTRAVEAALSAMAPGLTGITVSPQVFRPATFLESAVQNVGVAALLGLGLLVLVVGVALLSWRRAVVCIVPVLVSMTAAAAVLSWGGTTLTTLTVVGLAAATALVVDDAVGDMAATARVSEGTGVTASGTSAVNVVARVVLERRRWLACATLVVLLAVAPLLLLRGVPGAFAPSVVLSFGVALVVSLVVSLTLTPTLAALLLAGHRDASRTGPLAVWVRRGVDRWGAGWVRRPLRGLAVAAALLLVGGVALSQVGTSAVLPAQQDRTLLVRLRTAPGTSLPEMDRVTAAVTAYVQRLPGIRTAGYHVGRAVGADEIVDVGAGEVWVDVDPGADYARTLDAVRSTVRGFPGVAARVGTYADDRVAAVGASGAGASADDLVVRVYGPDLATLRGAADDTRQVLSTIEGVVAPTVQAQVSQPGVEIEVDLAAARRHGLRPGDVRREASTLISGLTVGSIYEQQKIFDVVVWGGPQTRHSVASLRSLTIDTPDGGHVRLGDVATVRLAPNPVAITHDAVSRSLDVTASVRGRDVGEVAQEVGSRLRGVRMPFEYRAEVLTDATESRNSARQLVLVTLAALLVGLLVLQAVTRSWRAAVLVLLSAPLAAAGALAAGPLVGGVSSLGVLAAAVAVGALALRQGLVLVRRAQELQREFGEDARTDAVLEATREAAPPVLLTALAAAAAALPFAVLGTRSGTELAHPLAVCLLAGLASSTAVVLLVLPALHRALGADSPPGSRPITPADEPQLSGGMQR